MNIAFNKNDEPVELKTVEEWLKTLPRTIRNKALFNMNKTVAKHKVPDLISAIFGAFPFDKTKEGKEYWNQIVAQLMEGETPTDIRNIN